MNYETVFDINQKVFEWGFAIPFAAVLVLGLILLRRKPKSQWQVVGLCLCLLGSIGTFISGSSYVKLLRNRSALNGGKFLIVEGKVTNFRPMPPQRHTMESFQVNGKRFEYSDRSVTPGFNQTVPAGGPVRDGEMVRVSYYDGYILKLEIQRE